jgi:hypothetical protein
MGFETGRPCGLCRGRSDTQAGADSGSHLYMELNKLQAEISAALQDRKETEVDLVGHLPTCFPFSTGFRVPYLG